MYDYEVINHFGAFSLDGKLSDDKQVKYWMVCLVGIVSTKTTTTLTTIVQNEYLKYLKFKEIICKKKKKSGQVCEHKRKLSPEHSGKTKNKTWMWTCDIQQLALDTQ